MREGEKPTPLQLYEIIRDKYAHEDVWIQQRIGWLLTANGFLFAGYGALFSLSHSQMPPDVATVVRRSLMVISLVGVVLAFLVGFGIYGAYSAKKGAKEEWSSLVSDDIRQHFPEIDAAAKYKWLGSLTSGILCTFLFFVWVFITAWVFKLW